MICLICQIGEYFPIIKKKLHFSLFPLWHLLTTKMTKLADVAQFQTKKTAKLMNVKCGSLIPFLSHNVL
jgi:hypothetical protein